MEQVTSFAVIAGSLMLVLLIGLLKQRANLDSMFWAYGAWKCEHFLHQ